MTERIKISYDNIHTKGAPKMYRRFKILCHAQMVICYMFVLQVGCRGDSWGHALRDSPKLGGKQIFIPEIKHNAKEITLSQRVEILLYKNAYRVCSTGLSQQDE